VREVFVNLNQSLKSFQQLAEDSRRLVQQGGGSVKGLDRAMATLQQVIDQVQALLGSHGEDLDAIVVRLAGTLKEMEGLGRELRGVVQQAGPDAGESLKSLDRTLRATENLLELLKAKPNRLVWGKPSQAEQEAAEKKVEEARKAQGAKP
jgi:paraquat-inducible protein B